MTIKAIKRCIEKLNRDKEQPLILVNILSKLLILLDSCFDKKQTNQKIYDKLVKRITLSSLEGINGTVFMYGQTGSGKTFTMMGSKNFGKNVD